MKRILSMIAVLLMTTMLLTACGGAAKTTPPAPTPGGTAATGIDAIELKKGTPVEIEFWHIQATIYGEAVKEMVADFNKRNEGQIIVKEVYKGLYPDLNKGLRAAISGGGMPNVSMAYENEILEYMQAGVAVEVDQYINSTKYGLTKAQLDDIIPGVLARQKVDAYKGKTMSWIHGNSSQGAYYNLNLLKKAGLTKPPATWDEMEAFGKKIKDATGVAALVISATSPQSIWRPGLGTSGVFALQGDGKVNIDTAEGLKIMNIMNNMVKAGTAILAADTEVEFINERAAVELSTTARTQTKIDLIKDKFPWGVTLTPQGKTGITPSTELYGGNHILLKSTPEKQLASWIFMKYFGSAEAQAIYAAKTGYFPAVKSAMEGALVKENYTKYPQKKQAFEEVSVHARIQPPHPSINSMMPILNDGLTAVFTGKMTPEQALKDMQAKTEKVIKDSK